MRSNFDTLRLYEKVFLLVLLAFTLCLYYLHGGMQQSSYYSYKINKDRYQITEATIVNAEVRYIPIRGDNPSFSFIETEVSYNVNGRNYSNKICTYDDKRDSETIMIAVNRYNAKKIRRCIPYSAAKDNFLRITLWAGKIMVCALVVIWMLNTVILYFRRKSDEKAIRKVDESMRKKEEQRQAENLEKQKKILSFCSGQKENPNLKMQIENGMKKSGVACNKDFVWCLTCLNGQKQFYPFLLLEQDDSGEFEFVKITMEIREMGLPHDYYVIAKDENNYLCGRTDSSRIFCFSKALGVTNTQYATIYDYILDKMA